MSGSTKLFHSMMLKRKNNKIKNKTYKQGYNKNSEKDT